MNMQPSASGRPREISVVEPVSPALERVKKMLFRPFDLARWITIGFCAWLAGLGESGGSFNYGNTGGDNGGSAHDPPAAQFRHFYHEATDFVMANLVWIIPAAVFVLLLVVTLWLLVLWLSSRGKFMFLHCVALDKAEVVEPWTRYAAAANSLFRFRIGLGLVGMILMLPLLVLAGLVIMRMVLQDEVVAAGVMTAAGLVLMFLLVAVVLAIVRKFTMDFVVPIQYLRGGSCLAAWRELMPLLAAHPGGFVLYILFQIVIAMAIGILVLVVVLATCCIAGCFLLLPFVGTVLLLPVLVFKRSYSLYYFAQHGYDVFPVVPPASPSLGGGIAAGL